MGLFGDKIKLDKFVSLFFMFYFAAIQDLVFAKDILINYLDDQQEKERSLQEENQVLTTTVADLKKDIHVQQIL